MPNSTSFMKWEAGVSGGGADKDGKGSEVHSIGEADKTNLTFGEALAKEGFEPLKTERKLIGRGIPKERLRKWSSRGPEK
ncbi:MAG: hypothetical protein QM684_09820 [Rhizobium sp.]